MAADAATPGAHWRRLPASAEPAEVELAAAEALLAGLAHTSQPALRWYGARRLALVIGAGQRLSEVDGAALAASGVSLHRRASGGTAVLFAPGVLMQDIALPTGHPLFLQDVSESYRWLGEVWAETLAEHGLATTLVSVAAARVDGQALDPLVRRACFGGRSPYEVLAGGRKLVGFAQLRRRPGALFQVALYTHWPGRELAALLRLAPGERATLTAALAARVTGLAEVLPVSPPVEQLSASFERVLARRHGVTLSAAGWRHDELAAISIARARYRPIDPGATIPTPGSS